jgi:hypothetical protein
MKNKHFYFTNDEWRYIIHSLNALKTKLISEGRYTDTVNEVMYKFMRAKTKRVKINIPAMIAG